MTAAVYALLDDRHATPGRPSSRLYTGYVRDHRCTDPSSLDAVWAAVESDQRAHGLHAVLLADYEWGAKLLGAGHERLAEDDAACLRVLLFRDCRRLDRQAVDDWLAEREGTAAPGPAGTMGLRASVDADAFTVAIDRIHAAIRAGETYQVNYTYRLSGTAHGSPVALYRRLRARQPVEFGAFIALPLDPMDAPGAGWSAPESAGPLSDAGVPVDRPAAQRHILSCSPELFLRHAGGMLTARPMKGTASRTLAPEGDSETARLLSLDIKNRAENLMIVDLLRNDLGRIARTGSVRVPALFAIEPYSTVFQMTSTIEAQLAPDVGFADVLRATFPCGSITGAPKHHTMQLIADLESTPRGIYCGGIGWVDAPTAGRCCGDFCLSVGIRTLTLGPEGAGQRPARLGIGAGIVLDSVAEDEFEECRLKGRFLTRLDPGFALFETMRWQPGEGVPHLELHLARLAASAAVFGFADERDAVLAALQRAVVGQTGMCRVRLALSVDGRVDAVCTPLAPLVTLTPLAQRAPLISGTVAMAGAAEATGLVGLVIADQRLPNADPLSAHKTTRRAAYDAGVAAAERVGAFDSVWFTADGRLAEGGRSNVFLRLDGRWFTPPVADGALPGIARGRLLADAAFGAVERTLHLADLQRAEAIVVCNALRGRLDARLLT